MTLYDFNQVLFWLAVFVLGWNAYFMIFNRGIPNIRTAPAIRKKIIEILKEDCNKCGKPDYTIFDIGSGNGLFTREIAKALPQAKVIGLEISRQQYTWAMMMKRRQDIKNLEYHRVNFYDYDMSPADAVTLFFLETDRVAKKLRKDLKPGTLVTSNKFPLGDGWKYEELLRVKTWYPFQKKLYIYRKH
jgi:SAM-dependent methyltransferase